MKARPTTLRHDAALLALMVVLLSLEWGSKVFGWAMGRRRKP